MKLSSPIGMQLTQAISSKKEIHLTFIGDCEVYTVVPSAFTSEYIQVVEKVSATASEVTFFDFDKIAVLTFHN